MDLHIGRDKVILVVKIEKDDAYQKGRVFGPGVGVKGSEDGVLVC